MTSESSTAGTLRDYADPNSAYPHPQSLQRPLPVFYPVQRVGDEATASEHTAEDPVDTNARAGVYVQDRVAELRVMNDNVNAVRIHQYLAKCSTN